MESTLLVFSLLSAPIDKTTFNNPLIVTETPIVQQVEPPQPTIEEKIAQNFYKCDTDTQWIRKDTAECKPKAQSTPHKAQRPVKSAVKYATSDNTAGNTYSYGYCTWYVKNRLSWVQNGWGDARSWATNARNAGFTVSSTPIIGSVATKSNHVAVVESISGDQITISEMNYQGWNISSSRAIPITGWQFIY